MKFPTEKWLIPLSTSAAAGVIANQFPQNQKSVKQSLTDEPKKKRVRKSFSPIIKSDDPFFNHKAAQYASDLVMKMDEETARTFTSFMVGEILDEEIDENLRSLQSHVTKTALSSIEEIKKSVKRTVIAKNVDLDEVDSYIQSLDRLEEIIKEAQSPYTTGHYQFQESDFRRDPRSGQFQRKIIIDPRKEPLTQRQAKVSLDIPPATVSDPRRLSQYQQEYMQIANFLDAVAAGGQLGEHDVKLQIQRDDGERYLKNLTARPTGGILDGDDWNPNEERVIGIEAKPKSLTLGGAAFGLTNSLGAPMGNQSVGIVNRTDDHIQSFATNWDRARNTDSHNANDRLFAHVKAGSTFLNQIAPYGSKAQIAARFGEFIGSRGPEAEKVFGPKFRTFGYRYRGVERAPDPEMLDAYDRVVRGESRRSAALTPEETSRLRALQSRRVTAAREAKAAQLNEGKTGAPGRVTSTSVNQEHLPNLRRIEQERALVPIEAVKLTQEETRAARNQALSEFMARRNAASEITPNALDAGRDEVSRHLISNNKGLYNLHLEAGHTPPSEGVIIDRNGKIAVQAVGYGDDHYLPFNLRHLGALKGGEYIRTRSVGGPTSEDIYTGLMSGARRLQVNSRSGTFIVEFEDDFRGRRRFNDKARRMVSRYQEILDAVQSEQVDRMGVSPETQKMFLETINTRYPGLPSSEKKKMLQERIEEYKKSPDIEPDDEVEIERYLQGVTQGMTEAQAQEVRSNLYNQKREEKEYKFRLNGIGYAAALKTLEEQFPYYIKTYDRPVADQPERQSFEPDKGYVQPGRNRPSLAAAGLHGAKHFYKPVEHSRKFRADEADYQGSNAPAPTASTGDEENTNTDGTDSNKPDVKLSDKEKKAKAFKEEVEAAQRRFDTGNWAYEFMQRLKSRSPNWEHDSTATPALRFAAARSDEELKQYLQTPNGINDFKNMWERHHVEFERTGYIDATDKVGYERAMGNVDRREASPANLFVAGRGAMVYKDSPAYSAGASATEVEHELTKYGDSPSLTVENKLLRNMSDAELVHEINVASRINTIAPVMEGAPAGALYDFLKNQGVEINNPDVFETLRDRKALEAHADKLQRMRALMVVRSDKPSTQVTDRKVVDADPVQAEATTMLNREVVQDHINVLEKAVDTARAARGSKGEREDPRLYAEWAHWLNTLRNQYPPEEKFVSDEDLTGLESNEAFTKAKERAESYLANRPKGIGQ